ncbi:hypothetical protein Lnau_3063 [Legionella nautarum]|uniref:Uncharacterized protein n=1 Tax=Legionella nautarum TaxID=45070 RepID=A0A0W0WIJ4_9GAMM|nr:hypothetical protein [Legionella nautarum]KTD32152.1 hypothetical protein Lnau_3063 [Legionella nautarum]
MSKYFLDAGASVRRLNKNQSFDIDYLKQRFSWSGHSQIPWYEIKKTCLKLINDEASEKFKNAISEIGEHLFYVSAIGDDKGVREIFDTLNQTVDLSRELRDAFEDEVAKGFLFYLKNLHDFDHVYTSETHLHASLENDVNLFRIQLAIYRLSEYSQKIVIERYRKNLWPPVFYNELKDDFERVIAPFEEKFLYKNSESSLILATHLLLQGRRSEDSILYQIPTEVLLLIATSVKDSKIHSENEAYKIVKSSSCGFFSPATINLHKISNPKDDELHTRAVFSSDG